MSGKAERVEKVTPPADVFAGLPEAEQPDAVAAALQVEDIGTELAKADAVLDFLEKHGDDDAFALVAMMRPFFTAIGEQVDDLRGMIGVLKGAVPRTVSR